MFVPLLNTQQSIPSFIVPIALYSHLPQEG